MSRLNYLTDTQLALEDINHELKLLERLIADSMPLNGAQLQTLVEYRDRIAGFVAPFQNAAKDTADNLLSLQPTPVPLSEVDELRIESASIDELRQSISNCPSDAIV